MRGALSYNEQKVIKGDAELIFASRFSCDIDELGFTEKLNRFERLNRRSSRAHTNTMHLSLNFSPFDQIDSATMQSVAYDYMQRIGFGNQPYLVYLHKDTMHPHIHIVTSTIRPNGRAIDVHRIGKRLSEPARKAIEIEYGLIQAESMRRDMSLPVEPVSTDALAYDEKQTAQVLSRTLAAVLNSYHVTNLEELNLVLRRYNIAAFPAGNFNEDGTRKGLVYALTEGNGARTSVAIAASRLTGRPTIGELNKVFQRESRKKEIFTRRCIEILQKYNQHNGPLEEEKFRQNLAKWNIAMYASTDERTGAKNYQFVDHKAKVVLSSEIPELKGLYVKISATVAVVSERKKHHTGPGSGASLGNSFKTSIQLIEALLGPKYGQTGGEGPSAPKKKRKKKRS